MHVEAILQIGHCILQRSTHSPKSMRHNCFTNKSLTFIKINFNSNKYCAYHFANEQINPQSIFKEILLTNPEQFKIFKIWSKLHKILYKSF
jgi:hypothetical protein